MNPDSMSEADLTKSFTHDRPEPATQPPTERPAKACSICGQPLGVAVLDFHPTKQECLKALRARVDRLTGALWKIACYPQGPVTGAFDEPVSAREAREALK
jgi:hypothetical protein